MSLFTKILIITLKLMLLWLAACSGKRSDLNINFHSFIFKCTSSNQLLDFAAGDGTKSNPYVICSPSQLNNISQSNDYLDKHFILARDIDLAEFSSNDFNLIDIRKWFRWKLQW